MRFRVQRITKSWMCNCLFLIGTKGSIVLAVYFLVGNPSRINSLLFNTKHPIFFSFRIFVRCYWENWFIFKALSTTFLLVNILCYMQKQLQKCKHTLFFIFTFLLSLLGVTHYIFYLFFGFRLWFQKLDSQIYEEFYHGSKMLLI